MIIQALNDYYNILLNDPEIEIPKPGYSMAKVYFAAILSKEGELLDLVVTDEENDWIDLIVPYQKDRSSNVLPYFMCDNTKYVFGWDFETKKCKLTKDKFLNFKKLHQQILSDLPNVKARAMLNFLEKWNPEECLNKKVISNKIDLIKKFNGASIAFKLDCEKGYFHDDEEIKTAWEKYEKSIEEKIWFTQCLVSGEMDEVPITHPTIKGVAGAQKAGARLISVDKSSKAFESYNKTQCFNSPIGKSASFGYTTALNYMLKDKKHHVQVGDATTVFWAEDTRGNCEDLLLELFAPENPEKTDKPYDATTVAYVKDALACLKQGKPIQEKEDVNFYILGLSPNNARVSVRFWHKDNFGQVIQNVWQHHKDMEISNMRREIVPIPLLMFETIPRNAQNKELTPPLSGALMKSVFTGTAYPQGLFYAIINRIRADGEINDVRAGIIKAYLKRNARLQRDDNKERMITVSLNEQNSNVAYRLGRLFAVLEKAQKDAAEVKLNSTIKDRYFGTASASPRAVFPVLLKLTHHHISKARYGYISDLNIQEILQGVDNFPTHLNAEEQGLFILGYYHQVAALYQKKDSKNEEVVEND